LFAAGKQALILPLSRHHAQAMPSPSRGGWESSEMVRRYAHFSAEHLAPYADRLCALRLVTESAHGTNRWQAELSH
jgi:hypothetical protein